MTNNHLVNLIMDEIIWSPTRNEIKTLYPSNSDEMIEFYKKLNADRTNTLRQLIKERDGQ